METRPLYEEGNCTEHCVTVNFSLMCPQLNNKRNRTPHLEEAKVLNGFVTRGQHCGVGHAHTYIPSIVGFVYLAKKINSNCFIQVSQLQLPSFNGRTCTPIVVGLTKAMVFAVCGKPCLRLRSSDMLGSCCVID